MCSVARFIRDDGRWKLAVVPNHDALQKGVGTGVSDTCRKGLGKGMAIFLNGRFSHLHSSFAHWDEARRLHDLSSLVDDSVREGGAVEKGHQRADTRRAHDVHPAVHQRTEGASALLEDGVCLKGHLGHANPHDVQTKGKESLSSVVSSK